MNFPISKARINSVNELIGLGLYGKKVIQRYFISLTFINSYVRPHSRIMEIGPGGIIAYLNSLNKFHTLALVNPREQCWDDVFPKLGIPLIRYDLNNSLGSIPPEHQNQYDLIIFYETLEHLNRWPEFVIQDISRLLKDSGTLSISVPNLVRFTNRFRMLLGIRPTNPFKYTDDGMYHVREYCFEEICDFFPSEFWHLLEFKYINQASKYLNLLCYLPGLGRFFGDVILFNFKKVNEY